MTRHCPWCPQVALLDESVVRIDNCGLEALPEEVLGKRRLRELVASKNHLKVLPQSLCLLRTLTVLKLDRNKLCGLPPGIGRLTALQLLDLHDNQVRAACMHLSPCVVPVHANSFCISIACSCTRRMHALTRE